MGSTPVGELRKFIFWEKIKLPKKSHGMVIFWVTVRRTSWDLSSQADPAKENWTEVIHILIKTYVPS